MNSSVTWDRATSVMSSLCLEISASSRSNGPSNTSRWTWKPVVPPVSPVVSPSAIVLSVSSRLPVPVGRVQCFPVEARGQHAGLPPCVEVGEQDSDRLPDQAPPVGRHPEPPQPQPGVLQVEQFLRGQVDSDLLGVAFPSGGLAALIQGQPVGGWAQQFRDARYSHPPGPGPPSSACRH